MSACPTTVTASLSTVERAILAEQSARHAFFLSSLREPISHDCAVPWNRPTDRLNRLHTLRFLKGAADAKGLGAAKRAAATYLRGLGTLVPVEGYVGVYAYDHKRGGWHAHFSIVAPRVEQSALDALVARQGGIDNAQVNHFRLAGELMVNGLSVNPDHFLPHQWWSCPEARNRAVASTVSTFEYMAIQPLTAPPSATLVVVHEGAETFAHFRDHTWDGQLCEFLLTVPARKAAYGTVWQAEAQQHQHAAKARRLASEGVYLPGRPVRGRTLQHVEGPCPVCASHMPQRQPPLPALPSRSRPSAHKERQRRSRRRP